MNLKDNLSEQLIPADDAGHGGPGYRRSVSYIEIEFTTYTIPSLPIATNGHDQGMVDYSNIQLEWCQWWRIKMMHIWDLQLLFTTESFYNLGHY